MVEKHQLAVVLANLVLRQSTLAIQRSVHISNGNVRVNVRKRQDKRRFSTSHLGFKASALMLVKDNSVAATSAIIPFVECFASGINTSPITAECDKSCTAL